MKIDKKKFRLLCIKWKMFFPIKINKIIRHYLRRIYRYSDPTYKKHLEILFSKKEINNKTTFKILQTMATIMREELKVMHKDGNFYKRNLNFIYECDKIIKLNNDLGREIIIAFAANILTLEECQEITTWEMFDARIEKEKLLRLAYNILPSNEFDKIKTWEMLEEKMIPNIITSDELKKITTSEMLEETIINKQNNKPS